MFATLLAHVPVIYVTRPTEDWCEVVASALGGDIVMFEPGDYLGGCDIDARVADKDGERTVLQSFYPDQLAVFRAPDDGDATLTVQGERLVLLQVAFEGGQPGQSHVDVGSMLELTVRRTRMSGDVDAGVRLIDDTGDLLVDTAYFEGIGNALALDGAALQSLEIDRSVIEGGGMAVGPNVPGLVRDSTILDAPNAALRWDAGPGLTIDASVLQGSVAVSVGGPVVVQNSFLVGSDLSLVGDATVRASTVSGPIEGAPTFHSSAVWPFVPSMAPDSVGCEAARDCWLDPEAHDFTPRLDGPLVAAGATLLDLERDWCSSDRSETPTAGALEAGALSPGPFAAEARGTTPCLPVSDTHPTPETADTGSTTPAPTGTDQPAPPETETDPPGCGCGNSPAPHGLLIVTLLLALFPLRREPGGASRSA